jgi:SAM-dependent methyltransferase
MDALESFFESGRAHIDLVMDTIKSHLDASFHPMRALDSGCGVGRSLVPLASIADSVVGMDVSDSMLQEAARHCDQRGMTNVTLIGGDDALSSVSGTFDLIHAYLVFQHIAPKRGEALVKRLIEYLVEGGVGVLYLTYATKWPVRWGYSVLEHVPFAYRILNLVRHRDPGYPQFQMHVYDLNSLFLIVQGADCHNIHVRFACHKHWSGLILFFQKRALGDWNAASQGDVFYPSEGQP